MKKDTQARDTRRTKDETKGEAKPRARQATRPTRDGRGKRDCNLSGTDTTTGPGPPRQRTDGTLAEPSRKFPVKNQQSAKHAVSNGKKTKAMRQANIVPLSEYLKDIDKHITNLQNPTALRGRKEHDPETTWLPLNLAEEYPAIRATPDKLSAGALGAGITDLFQELTAKATGGDKAAVEYVATLAVGFTNAAEHLAINHAESARAAATQLRRWPVTVTLDENGTLEDVSYLLSLLKWLRVDKRGGPLPVIRHYRFEKGRPKSRLFLVAAANVYQRLLAARSNPGWYLTETEWARDFLALREPMTEATLPAWWRVAEQYIKEQWRINRAGFDFVPVPPSQNNKGADEAYVIARIRSGWRELAKILDKENSDAGS